GRSMSAYDVEFFVIGHSHRSETRMVLDVFFVDAPAVDLQLPIDELLSHALLDSQLAAADGRAADQIAGELEFAFEGVVDGVGDVLGYCSFHGQLFRLLRLVVGRDAKRSASCRHGTKKQNG